MDKIKSSLIGGMLGDALGYSREFATIKEILRPVKNNWRSIDFDNYAPGKGNFHARNGNVLISDDTQMTLAVGKALREASEEDGAAPPTRLAFEDELYDAYLEWYNHPDNNRAPGGACMTAMKILAEDKEETLTWVDATGWDSLGCGANMRVAPLAFNDWEPQTRWGLAMLSSVFTHAHPAAMITAAITTEAIHAAYKGLTRFAILDELETSLLALACTDMSEWIGDYWSERNWEKAFITVHNTIQDVADTLASSPEYDGDPCSLFGGGWIATEALANALWCVVRYWDKPVEVLQRGAASNGDSDSIASIAGQIRGAAGVDWSKELPGSMSPRRLEYSYRYRMLRLADWLSSTN